MAISDWSALYALAGTIFGGAGLELTKRWLNRSKERDDAATKFRQELRDDLNSVKEELARAEKELNDWREKYFSLYERYLTVKSQLEEALRQIQRDADHAANMLPPNTEPPVDKGPLI